MVSIILELQSSYLPNKNFDILHEMVENLCYIWPMRKEEDSLNILIRRGKMELLHANITNNRHHVRATAFFVFYTENFRHNRWSKEKGHTHNILIEFS